jgi:hypothetical protein
VAGSEWASLGSVEKKILESGLYLSNGRRSLLGLRLDLRSSGLDWSRWEETRLDRLLSSNLILHGSWARRDWLLLFDILECNLQAKLELSLGSTIELLVDRGVVGIEGDEGSGAVGITLEDDLGGGWDSEEKAKLYSR